MTSFPTKINIGCGYDKRPDFLNIDSDPACAPDILIINNDLSGLPQGHFEEAIALDVLEHIPRAQMMGALFDWAALLKTGGPDSSSRRRTSTASLMSCDGPTTSRLLTTGKPACSAIRCILVTGTATVSPKGRFELICTR